MMKTKQFLLACFLMLSMAVVLIPRSTASRLLFADFTDIFETYPQLELPSDRPKPNLPNEDVSVNSSIEKQQDDIDRIILISAPPATDDSIIARGDIQDDDEDTMKWSTTDQELNTDTESPTDEKVDNHEDMTESEDEWNSLTEAAGVEEEDDIKEDVDGDMTGKQADSEANSSTEEEVVDKADDEHAEVDEDTTGVDLDEENNNNRLIEADVHDGLLEDGVEEDVHVMDTAPDSSVMEMDNSDSIVVDDDPTRLAASTTDGRGHDAGDLDVDDSTLIGMLAEAEDFPMSTAYES